jgi:hypothetical protein
MNRTFLLAVGLLVAAVLLVPAQQGAAQSPVEGTDTMMLGIEVSPGIIIAGTRYGAAFTGLSFGDLPGTWVVTIRYNNPPAPKPGVTNHIVGGSWLLNVYQFGVYRGSIWGVVTGGTATWPSQGDQVADVKAGLSITGGSGAFSGALGAQGTFTGKLSHVTFPPTMSGTLSFP